MAEEDFAMGTVLNIRQVHTADDLRQLAGKCRNADWSRLLLALSLIYVRLLPQPGGLHWPGRFADHP